MIPARGPNTPAALQLGMAPGGGGEGNKHRKQGPFSEKKSAA
jgi:hypothetical protein